jgi:hypothetical protein
VVASVVELLSIKRIIHLVVKGERRGQRQVGLSADLV